jgi:hypothetical protein
MALRKNQVPPLTDRAKAARRRDRIASVALFVVIAAGVALTIYVWIARRTA